MFMSGGMICWKVTQADHRPNRGRFMTNTANQIFAAAFSIVISFGLFAYAIVPASPTTLV